ncbi:hypothetical protein ACXIVK_24190 [Paraburkholderia caledonica]
MRDFKFAARMVFAFAAIVLVLGIAQKWDDAESMNVRVSMRSV